MSLFNAICTDLFGAPERERGMHAHDPDGGLTDYAVEAMSERVKDDREWLHAKVMDLQADHADLLSEILTDRAQGGSKIWRHWDDLISASIHAEALRRLNRARAIVNDIAGFDQ